MDRGEELKVSLLVSAVAVGLSRAGRKALPIAEVHDVLEFRRARRQVRGVQEIRIEGKFTRWSAINQRAAFERSGSVFRIEQTDQRTAIMQRSAILQKTEKIMQPPIGSKIRFSGRSIGHRADGKVYVFSGCNCRSVISIDWGSSIQV